MTRTNSIATVLHARIDQYTRAVQLNHTDRAAVLARALVRLIYELHGVRHDPGEIRP